MASQTVPFMLLKGPIAQHAVASLRGFTTPLKGLLPFVGRHISKTNLHLSAEDYIGLTLLNSLFYLGFFLLFFVSLQFFSALPSTIWSGSLTTAAVSELASQQLNLSLLYKTLLYSLLLFALFVIVLFTYPHILAKKKAENIDRNLIFALKNVSLQIRASVPLYNALITVSQGDYGEVSTELEEVAQDISAGKSMGQALEAAALRTNSEFMKKIVRQLITSMNAGANMKSALQVVIDDLMEDQKSKIKSYVQELNVWTLVFLLFAVAIPSIGSTIFIILSSFAGIGLTEGLFIFFLLICIFIQIAIIGLIKSRRPVVYAWK